MNDARVIKIMSPKMCPYREFNHFANHQACNQSWVLPKSCMQFLSCPNHNEFPYQCPLPKDNNDE